MGWIEELFDKMDNSEKKPGFRDNLMMMFTNTVNTLRADGFSDLEVYHMMLCMADDEKYWAIHTFWPLFEYWCEVFLDWDDETEVEK